MKTKFNTTQILYSLSGLVIGFIVMTLGVLSSGAGHGPNPQLSIAIAFLGVVIFLLSLLILLILIISGFLGKELFKDDVTTISGIPTYNWRCPRCDEVVKANNGVCGSCSFSIKNSPNH